MGRLGPRYDDGYCPDADRLTQPRRQGNVTRHTMCILRLLARMLAPDPDHEDWGEE